VPKNRDLFRWIGLSGRTGQRYFERKAFPGGCLEVFYKERTTPVMSVAGVVI